MFFLSWTFWFFLLWVFKSIDFCMGFFIGQKKPCRFRMVYSQTPLYGFFRPLDQAKLVQQLFKMTLVRLFYSYKTLIWLISCLTHQYILSKYHDRFFCKLSCTPWHRRPTQFVPQCLTLQRKNLGPFWDGHLSPGTPLTRGARGAHPGTPHA